MTSIAEALVATAIGLVVAIPAVAAYNTFQRLTKSTLANTEVLSRILMAHLKAAAPHGASQLMAGGSQGDVDEGIVGINVTPLVDITLVLLIIFMVVAKMVVSQSVPLDLPKAASGTDVQVVFSLELYANGEIVGRSEKLANDEALLALAREGHAQERRSARGHQGRRNRPAPARDPRARSLEAGGDFQNRFRGYPDRARAGGNGGACRFEVTSCLPRKKPSRSRIYDLDSRRMRTRDSSSGFCGALIVHVAAASEAARLATGMGSWALDLRSDVHAYLAKLYEVDLVEPPPPPPPPPEDRSPNPELRSTATGSRAQPRTDREGRASPAARTSGQDPHPGARSQRAGRSHRRRVRHRQRRIYAGGVTANNGTSTNAVRNRNAAPGGVQGGTGNTGGPADSFGPDLSHRRPRSGRSRMGLPVSRRSRRRQIDFQTRAHHRHRSSADGTRTRTSRSAGSRHRIRTPARQCALALEMEPRRDRDGQPKSELAGASTSLFSAERPKTRCRERRPMV